VFFAFQKKEKKKKKKKKKKMIKKGDREDEDSPTGSPFAGINKASVIMDSRAFNDAQVFFNEFFFFFLLLKITKLTHFLAQLSQML
jgi:hypothetical protein